MYVVGHFILDTYLLIRDTYSGKLPEWSNGPHLAPHQNYTNQIFIILRILRKSGRVVEGTSLEKMHPRNGIVSSNLTSSAKCYQMLGGLSRSILIYRDYYWDSNPPLSAKIKARNITAPSPKL